MPDFSFRTAHTEFREEIRKAITAVDVNEQALHDFAELFVADFSGILDKPEGEAIWRRDGLRVRRLGRYLGTLAEFYAVARLLDERIEMSHLMRALRIIQPECKLRALPVTGERQDYCRGVKPVVETPVPAAEH